MAPLIGAQIMILFIVWIFLEILMEMRGLDWDDLRYGQRFVLLDLPWFGVDLLLMSSAPLGVARCYLHIWLLCSALF